MLNNKGFAVSSVLYTLLIAFLLFLGAALAQFSASSSLIGKANEDLINGVKFSVVQIKPNGACINTDTEGKYDWYLQYRDDNKNKNDRVVSNTIIKIKSRYGMKYWPKDFKYKDFENNDVQANLTETINDATAEKEHIYTSYDGNISVEVKDKNEIKGIETPAGVIDNTKFYIRVLDIKLNKEAEYPSKNKWPEKDDSRKNYMVVTNVCAE